MFCPNCGTKNAEGAAFCASCGSALNAAPIQQDVPVAAPVEEFVTAPETVETPAAEKKDLLAPIRPLLQKVEPFIQKYKLFVAGALGVLALILCISILVSLFSTNGFITMKHSIGVQVKDEEVYIIYDAKKAKATGLDAKRIDQTQVNIDGTVLALLTDEGQLAVVKGTKLTKVAEDVTSFKISEDGTGIAYVVRDEDGTTLFLYNVKNKKSKEVSDDLYRSYTIAPNGDSVAYMEMKEDDEEAKLMFFKGKKSIKVTSNAVSLLGISNNGKFIYAIGENDDGKSTLYTYNKKGDRNKLGSIGGSEVIFNEDHTQILFYSDGKSYISTKGKEAVKIASTNAYVLIPNSSEYFYSSNSCLTAPTDNLYNKVYSCNGDVWYIRKNVNKNEKLVNDAYGLTLSEDGERVYYYKDDELCVLQVKHGDNASDKAKVLAEDITDYVVTSDGKKVYYISDDSVYCVNAKNGKGKKTVANDDVESYLYINAKDVVYYIMEGDAYASKNGSKGKKVVSDAEDIDATANGIVYIETDDTIFATKGAKKPSKIHTTD